MTVKASRRKITPEFLSRVAEIHRAAPEGGRLAAVKVAFMVNERQALRYIAAARKKGWLPPRDRTDMSNDALHAHFYGSTLVDTKDFSRLLELTTMAELRGISRTKLVEIAVNEYLSRYPISLGDPRYGR
jgi:hypothetical protein